MEQEEKKAQANLQAARNLQVQADAASAQASDLASLQRTQELSLENITQLGSAAERTARRDADAAVRENLRLREQLAAHHAAAPTTSPAQFLSRVQEGLTAEAKQAVTDSWAEIEAGMGRCFNTQYSSQTEMKTCLAQLYHQHESVAGVDRRVFSALTDRLRNCTTCSEQQRVALQADISELLWKKVGTGGGWELPPVQKRLDRLEQFMRYTGEASPLLRAVGGAVNTEFVQRVVRDLRKCNGRYDSRRCRASRAVYEDLLFTTIGGLDMTVERLAPEEAAKLMDLRQCHEEHAWVEGEPGPIEQLIKRDGRYTYVRRVSNCTVESARHFLKFGRRHDARRVSLAGLGLSG